MQSHWNLLNISYFQTDDNQYVAGELFKRRKQLETGEPDVTVDNQNNEDGEDDNGNNSISSIICHDIT